MSDGVADGSGGCISSGVPDIPKEKLLAELPLEQTDLLPLAALVERLANNAYQTLQSLGEVLPSFPNDVRKAKIFSTALELRKQFIKLLVIVRWSKDAEQLNRARNVVALLVDQQWAHEDVFSGLTQARKILPNARMRDADIATAVDIIRTGTYQRLPASIRDSAIPQPPLSDQEALEAVKSLDEVLRVRLTCSETLPPGLRLERIADGKAYFEAPGLYTACLTTAGSKPTDRWWMLDFAFLHEADAGGESLAFLDTSFLSTVHATAETILSSHDQEMAEQPTESETSAESQPLLVKLHEALELQTLQRQLSILQHQAQNMARLNWGANIHVSMDSPSRTLEIQYWTQSKPPSKRSTAPKESSGSVIQHLEGKLSLRVETKDVKGAQRVLSALIKGNATTAPSVSCSSIKVDWHVDPVVRTALDESERDVRFEKLDIEALLLNTIDKHTFAVMHLLRRSIVESNYFKAHAANMCVLRTLARTQYGPRYTLQIQLPGLRVLLYVACISGKVVMKPLDTPDSQDTEEYLRLSLSETQSSAFQNVAEQISANPDSVNDALFQLQLQSLSERLEAQAAWLGLTAFSPSFLRLAELKKTGLHDGRPVLFLRLEYFPTYFVMLYLTPGKDIQFALLCIVTVPQDGKALRVVSSVKWLDHDHICSFSVSPAHMLVPAQTRSEMWEHLASDYSVKNEELSLVYSYCIATIAYSQLEEQLKLELVPFALVGATTNIPAPPTKETDPLLPSLCISAHELLGTYSHLAGRNVSMKFIDWWYLPKLAVEIVFELHTKQHTVNIPPAKIRDAVVKVDEGLFIYTTQNIGASLVNFQKDWSGIAKLFSLVHAITSYTSSHSFTVTLEHFDLSSVTFSYGFTEAHGPKYTCSLCFEPSEVNAAAIGLTLTFGTHSENSSETPANPHHLLANLLETELNRTKELNDHFWLGLIKVCIHMCREDTYLRHLS